MVALAIVVARLQYLRSIRTIESRDAHMSSNTLHVRLYAEKDEEDVVDLWQICFPNDPPWNAPWTVIDCKLRVQRELFLVGELHGRIICTALGGYDGFGGWVYHVATLPRYRRAGFGRRMMQEMERRLREKGCSKLNLQLRRWSDAALAFYRALGYRVEDRISMGKRLG
ncbi:MAG: GNAT family acetyltransferase [Gammaproteobacteria bacterium]|nr:GNAT family acetyltransferase [Gammaproteobacteria bacterium]NIR84595.1 GNAT family acetyltransferase [Gammaproteobacteria bacterium]NIR90498.1 GNAT family acetyltransferase [Gammaproteobacteria bacterium]NIU05646.1 GNAT family acetyltransferase [Gammaproteobacteria bacterium]NIV52785.1 GNAT family acetyltransferase [Gammaproteobacteria bacterium]